MTFMKVNAILVANKSKIAIRSFCELHVSKRKMALIKIIKAQKAPPL